jgi:hypothetical protein
MSESHSGASQLDVSAMKITKFRASRYNASKYTCEITVSLGEKTYVLTLPVFEVTSPVVLKKGREWRNRPGNPERVLAAIKAGLNHVPANTAK